MSSGLTPDEVLYRMENGETQADIARGAGVSRQYVSQLAKAAGWESPFKRVTENLPWDVSPMFSQNTIYKNVRRHGIWVTTGHLADTDLAQLRSFYKKLEQFNCVVDYDPSYPANPGFTNTPGFTYLPRSEADEDYIMKIKPSTRLTADGREIWRIAKNLPDEK